MDFNFHGSETMGDREDLWSELAKKMTGETYLALRDHFDEHVKDDSVEDAYICLVKVMLSFTGMQNSHVQQMYFAATGDNMGDFVKEEE